MAPSKRPVFAAHRSNIREWYWPQARIAGHLTIQPLGQFQPAPRVSVGPTRIVQECGALATYRPVSRVSISTICRCITGARSDPIEVVPRCPDIIFGKDRPPRHTAVSRRAVSRASPDLPSRRDRVPPQREPATECRSVNFARAVRMMGARAVGGLYAMCISRPTRSPSHTSPVSGSSTASARGSTRTNTANFSRKNSLA
jgi:hypothetical protein